MRRPRTAAEATAALSSSSAGELAAAWAAESPATPGGILGAESGQPCGQCGAPMRWTADHTALVCVAHRPARWDVSPGARTRSAEHLAAIDQSAARRSAQLADPAAERAAAEALEAERAELLDDLEGLAEALDVTGFTRTGPYGEARRAGIRYGAIVEQVYAERARKAGKLDQLARVRADAETFAASIGGWLDHIARLRDTLTDDQEPARGQVIRGAVDYAPDDDWPDDDDDGQAAADRAAIESFRADLERAFPLPGAPPRPALPPGTIAPAAVAHLAAGHVPDHGPWCDRCRTAQYRIGGRYPRAIARAEILGQPFEDLCAGHLAEAQHAASSSGVTLHISERYMPTAPPVTQARFTGARP